MTLNMFFCSLQALLQMQAATPACQAGVALDRVTSLQLYTQLCTPPTLHSCHPI